MLRIKLIGYFKIALVILGIGGACFKIAADTGLGSPYTHDVEMHLFKGTWKGEDIYLNIKDRGGVLWTGVYFTTANPFVDHYLGNPDFVELKVGDPEIDGRVFLKLYESYDAKEDEAWLAKPVEGGLDIIAVEAKSDKREKLFFKELTENDFQFSEVVSSLKAISLYLAVKHQYINFTDIKQTEFAGLTLAWQQFDHFKEMENFKIIAGLSPEVMKRINFELERAFRINIRVGLDYGHPNVIMQVVPRRMGDMLSVESQFKISNAQNEVTTFYHEGLNFDLNTGKLLTITDFLGDGANTEKVTQLFADYLIGSKHPVMQQEDGQCVSDLQSSSTWQFESLGWFIVENDIHLVPELTVGCWDEVVMPVTELREAIAALNLKDFVIDDFDEGMN